MAASVLLILLWSYSRVSNAFKSGLTVPRTQTLGVMAGLWVLSLVSIFISDAPWYSVMAFFFMGALPLTFLTLAINPYTDKEWRVTLMVLGAVMGVLGGWALIQFLFFHEYFSGRAVHPLRDPSSLAALFNLALIGALGCMSYAKTSASKITAFLLALLLSGGVIATGSRGALLAGFIGLILIAVLCWSAIAGNKRWWLAYIALATLFFATSPYLTPSPETMAGRMAITLGLEEGIVPGDRLDTMKAAWLITKDHWLTGTGIGTFYLNYPEYRPVVQADLVTHAHNDPLQMWAEMGILAPLLLYAFIALAIIATVRRMKQGDPTAQEKARVLFPFIALGVLIGHSHINFNFYNLSILMLAGLVAAYWLSAINPARREVSFTYGRAKQAALATVFAIAMIIYSCVIISEHYTYKARDAILAGDIEAYGTYLLLADQIGFQKNPTVYMTATHIPLTLLYQRKDELSPEDMKKEAAQINNNLNQTLHLNPHNGSAWYFKGLLVQYVPADLLPENMPTEKEAYEKALKLDPINIGARVALVDMALAKEDYKEAARWLIPSLHLVLFTDAAKQLYSRGLMVFAMTGDKENLEKTKFAMHEYEQRSIFSRWLKENRPWTPLTKDTFPQEAESKSE